MLDFVIHVAPEVPELQAVGHLLAGGGDQEVSQLPQGVAEGQQAQGAHPLPRAGHWSWLLTLHHYPGGGNQFLLFRLSLGQAKTLKTMNIPISLLDLLFTDCNNYQDLMTQCEQ